MTRVVTVVDYGVGNLFSIARSIEKAGGEARLSTDLIVAIRHVLRGHKFLSPR